MFNWTIYWLMYVYCACLTPDGIWVLYINCPNTWNQLTLHCWELLVKLRSKWWWRGEATPYIIWNKQYVHHQWDIFKNTLQSFLITCFSFFFLQMKNLTKNYFNEAKWLHSGYVPNYEEYMKVAEWTSGYPMLTAVSYVGMSESAKEADFEWAMKMPKLIKAAATIARLENDIVGHKVKDINCIQPIIYN